MKNKKIISLTIFAVVLVAFGILGLSKLFENGWQNENTVDNSLDAEIVDNVENIFNYPFEINEDMQIFINAYPNNQISSLEDFRGGFNGEYISQPDKNMITYQQAANYAGEMLKYLYGFTQPQNNTAKITFFDMYYYDEYYRGSTFYSYNNQWEYTDYSGKTGKMIVNVYINPYNGEIMQIVVKQETGEQKDTISSDIKVSMDKSELYQYAVEILNTIGINYDVEECYICNWGEDKINVIVKLTDEKIYNFWFDLQCDNYFVVFENSTDTGKHEIWVEQIEQFQQYKYNF